MDQQPSTSNRLVISIVTAAIVWAVVGVPVAAAIAAFRVFVWVITSLPEMAATAAALGAAHGLWLYLVGKPPESEHADLRWFGTVSGGVLGLLGFPPVFSRINGIVVDRLAVAVFLLAAIGGGIAAGFVSARTVVPVQLRGRRSIMGRCLMIGCFVVLPVAAVDYHFYWPKTLDRIFVPQAILELTGIVATRVELNPIAAFVIFRSSNCARQNMPALLHPHVITAEKFIRVKHRS